MLLIGNSYKIFSNILIIDVHCCLDKLLINRSMAIKPKDKKIMDHLVMVDPKALGVLRWEFLALSTINDLLFFYFFTISK